MNISCYHNPYSITSFLRRFGFSSIGTVFDEATKGNFDWGLAEHRTLRTPLISIRSCTRTNTVLNVLEWNSVGMTWHDLDLCIYLCDRFERSTKDQHCEKLGRQDVQGQYCKIWCYSFRFLATNPGFQKLAFSQSSPQNFT